MVASALVTAAGLVHVGRRYFYKKARKGLREIENKIAAGVATLAMSYRGKRKRSVSRGRSRTRSHVNKNVELIVLIVVMKVIHVFMLSLLLSLRSLLFPFVRKAYNAIERDMEVRIDAPKARLLLVQLEVCTEVL